MLDFRHVFRIKADDESNPLGTLPNLQAGTVVISAQANAHMGILSNSKQRIHTESMSGYSKDAIYVNGGQVQPLVR